MQTKNIKKIIISLFKLFTYFLLLLTFILTMSRVNYALLMPTRTSIVTSGSFIVILFVMLIVYGNFEIGHKKSKPVFLNTMISVFIANFIAAMAMLIMGVIEFRIQDILISTILHLLLTYLIQGVIIYVMAHLGNTLYFTLYEPLNVMFFNNDDFIFNKIHTYVNAHDKQFTVLGVFDQPNFDKLLNSNVDLIYAIGLDTQTTDKLFEICYKNNIRLILNATKYNFLIGKESSYVIDDVLLIDLSQKNISLYQLFVKRCMDILGSLVILILTIPVFIIVGVAIKIEDRGPIIYSQDRLTKDKKVFKIYKFRSMKQNCDLTPATVNDDRITKVGQVIRKLRIDELPQAINILKGDISLVGPRPESAVIFEKYLEDFPDFELRLKVKGGLTGYAQIFGKYNTTPEMKLLLDLKYIENYSLIEDIKLIFQTFMVFVRSDSTEGFSDSE